MAKGLSDDGRRALFERMALIRRFEEAIIHLATDHAYMGRQHLYIGHEAVAAPAAALLGAGDLCFTTHRNHGYIIARGVAPGRALAEVLGRAGGTNGGRGGPWHITDREAGFLSTSGMVGGSIGLGTGAALALKRAGGGHVSLAHFGDGTLDEGISFEALNIASLLSLPVLFLCENNAKEGQRPSSMLAAERLADLPAALSIPTTVIDGRNAEEVHSALSKAIETIRARPGPVFIQANLERWPGSHAPSPEFTTGVTDISSAWDEGAIEGEHADWVRDHDPILRYARALLAAGVVDKEALLGIDKRVSGEIAAARVFAEQSPFPAPETALGRAFA
jgi:TPP-dependent pyruvate/acetoin dehydrogenase alpha subunit